MPYQEHINAAALALERSSSVVTVSHRKPDGDTLGAMLGLAAALESLGKTVTRFCVDEVPRSLQYLAGSDRVTADTGVFAAADTVCVFDAGDLRFAQIDGVIANLDPKPVIVNIDHHATNERFGTVNCILTDAASTTEVVYRILEAMHFRMTSPIATALLTGLVTDTMLFFNPATSATSLQLASLLQRTGGDLKTVARHFSKNKSIEALVLWGKALERLKFDAARSHCSTVIRLEDAASLASDDDSSDGLSNFLNSTLEAHTVLVLREMEGGVIKGSIRTAREDIDVSAEAMRLGGGGHRKAAGFRAKGTVVELDNEWKFKLP